MLKKHMIVAGVASFALLGSNITQAALVNHWTFDEATGLVAGDSAGTNNGTWQNDSSTGMSWGSGMIGGAVNLTGDNGSDRSFSVGSIGLNGANQMTISMWLQPNISQTVDNTGVFTGRGSVSSRGGDDLAGQNWLVGYYDNSGARRMRYDSTGTTYSGDIYPSGVTEPAWVHVMYTWDGTTGTAGTTSQETTTYINGELSTSVAHQLRAICFRHWLGNWR